MLLLSLVTSSIVHIPIGLVVAIAVHIVGIIVVSAVACSG